MIFWFFSAALAGAPAGVDLQDVFAWEDAAERLLDGPSGCYEVQGVADRKLVVFVPPDLFSSGSQYEEVIRAQVTGRLVDGVWTTWTWTEDRAPADRKSLDHLLRGFPRLAERLDILPLIGKYGGKAPANLVREIVDEWGGRLSTSIADWDDDRSGVWLRREVPIRDRPSSPVSQVETFFPDGRDTPAELDVRFPASFKAGAKGIRFRLDDAQIHVRSGPEGPSIESASLLLVALGVTMGYEQTIRYTVFEACSAP